MTVQRKRSLALALVVLMASALACSLSALGNDSSTPEVAREVVPTAIPIQAAPQVTNAPVAASASAVDATNLEELLINLYRRVNPSVVHILVYTSRNDPAPLGSGSGFVYDGDGHIVTNNHVVEDGLVFEVVFADGSRQRAEVIGRDVDSDLAVIEVVSLPASANPVILGDSDQLQVGQLVIAIGNPFGEQGSMSLGIVSGLGRTLESQRQLIDPSLRYSLPEVVQTDAPINPGNSGGPLLNLRGEVVGINSAIRSTTGVNSGVGFSIPVNAVRRIVPGLIQEGSYTYAFMGVEIQSLNLNLQERYEVPQASGAYVTGLTPGGPADEAGLIPARASDRLGGDLIVAINGVPVEDTEALISFLVFRSEVGQTIELTVIRNGESLAIPLTLGARP